MAGMEALGRLNNIIPNVTTNTIFKVRGASCIMCCISGAAAVATLAQGSTFGGSFATAAAVVKNVYWSAAADGTAVWNKVVYPTNAIFVGGAPLSVVTLGTAPFATALMAVFHIFTSEIPNPFAYIKITITGSGILQVIPTDLVHQRAPANLEIMAS